MRMLNRIQTVQQGLKMDLLDIIHYELNLKCTYITVSYEELQLRVSGKIPTVEVKALLIYC